MKLTHTIKPTRAKAFEYVAKLKRGEQLEAREVDALLNYFAPAVPKVAKTAAQWVAKAASTDADRPGLYAVQVVGGTMYATDTHRLHWAPTELPAGTYCPKTLSELPPAMAPNYQAVMPDPSTLATINGAEFEAHLADNTDGKSKFDRYQQHPCGLAVCESYLTAALNGLHAAEVELRASDSMLYGRGPLGEFLIMGLRV